MVAFVLPPRGQVAPADGPMSMFRRYSQGEEDEVKKGKTTRFFWSYSNYSRATRPMAFAESTLSQRLANVSIW